MASCTCAGSRVQSPLAPVERRAGWAGLAESPQRPRSTLRYRTALRSKATATFPLARGQIVAAERAGAVRSDRLCCASRQPFHKATGLPETGGKCGGTRGCKSRAGFRLQRLSGRPAPEAKFRRPDGPENPENSPFGRSGECVPTTTGPPKTAKSIGVRSGQ